MKRQRLHLVDENNDPLSPAIRSAVEAAHYWAVREFPRVDPALLANWAERLAKSIANKDLQGSVRRYAHTAMHETVRRWLKTKQASELAVGLDHELESIAGIQEGFQGKVDRAILFEQLKSRLCERDRSILMLLQSDATPAEVAVALGMKYEAAAKAIQRVRARVAICLGAAQHEKRTTTLRRASSMDWNSLALTLDSNKERGRGIERFLEWMAVYRHRYSR
jgi:DNA-directed RNA polymerase specialized sigma24 family protein